MTIEEIVENELIRLDLQHRNKHLLQTTYERLRTETLKLLNRTSNELNYEVHYGPEQNPRRGMS